jgi:hypothetical protein
LNLQPIGSSRLLYPIELSSSVFRFPVAFGTPCFIEEAPGGLKPTPLKAEHTLVITRRVPAITQPNELNSNLLFLLVFLMT